VLVNSQMRISTASTQRKADSGQSAVIPPPPSLLDSDPANTTVFIGNLDNSVSPDQLRMYAPSVPITSAFIRLRVYVMSI
jgi:RNA recognition motif-containing protein